MQSGQRNTKEWLLESEPAPKEIDPLMGWTSSRDTMQQVKLYFATLEEATAYAQKAPTRCPTRKPRVPRCKSSVRRTVLRQSSRVYGALSTESNDRACAHFRQLPSRGRPCRNFNAVRPCSTR